MLGKALPTKKLLLTTLSISLLLFSSVQANVSAITKTRLNSLINNRPFYDSSSVLKKCSSGGSTDPSEVDASSGSQSRDEFLRKYVQAAYNNSLTTGVPYEVTLAQAIVESGLDSVLALKYNNFFGVKAGSSWTGPTVTLPTREFINGQERTVMAAFRVYATPEEGFADHDAVLRRVPAYANAFQYSNDPYRFLAVIAPIYATDPNYTKVVGSVIKYIQEWVAANTNLPPSSEVTYNISETPSAPPADTSSPSNGCPSTGTGNIERVECPNEGTAGLGLETKQVGDTTYYKLPDAPNGEYAIYATEKRRFGKKELVCAIYTVAKAYKAKYDGQSKVSVGDLNASGHKSHNGGIAVDIDAPGKLYAADHTKGNYSSEATVDFGKLWVDTGLVKNIWWCQPSGDTSTQQIIDYANAQGKPINMQCLSGHDNHFHVDINVEKGAYDAP